MYGYLKCFLPNMTRDERSVLRRYYCSTCLAIKKSYGYFSTAILSYDLTVLPIVLDVFDETIKKHKGCHYPFGSKKSVLDSELWRPIAALNLAIASENITDAMQDKGSVLKKVTYKFVGMLIHRGAKRAKRDYPELFEKASAGMKRIISAERDGADITTQGEAFASMIISSIETFAELDEDKRSLLRGISIWLCLMDAIDDFDKDIKQGAYNPLLYTEGLNSENKKELINSKYIEITKYINGFKPLLSAGLGKSKHGIINKAVEIYNYKVIPYQTSIVLGKG